MIPSEAASGPEALNLLHVDLSGFDVAILDYQMPGTDGLELARANRTEGPTAKLPIILLTSLGGYKELNTAEVRIAAFLTNPLDGFGSMQALQSVFGPPEGATCQRERRMSRGTWRLTLGHLALR